MEPKDWIKGRYFRIAHLSVASDQIMHVIVSILHRATGLLLSRCDVQLSFGKIACLNHEVGHEIEEHLVRFCIHEVERIRASSFTA